MKTIKSLITAVLVFAISFSAFGQDEVSEREVIALLELQSRTKGHLWTHQWDRNTPIAQWHGVTVKDGKVVALDLSNNNLQGKIPLTIGNLKFLRHLDLSNNHIEGKMPRLFRKLQYLETIDLAGNNLEGPRPTTIHRLASLTELNVAGNNLEGSLPEALTELSKLTTLAVADNAFEGTMPAGMEKMKKLKKLYIANNAFSNLDNLRSLAAQQIVMTDIDVNSANFKPIDFEQNGLSKLEFVDENE